MSNNHIIEQIISQADIVKIIGKHVELKRSGNEYKGCCPFHGEKSPSFFVSPQKGLYNCFGCGVGGNALTFLKEYEHLTAGEALRELSRQTGIELPKEPINKNLIYQKTMPNGNNGKTVPQPKPSHNIAQLNPTQPKNISTKKHTANANFPTPKPNASTLNASTDNSKPSAVHSLNAATPHQLDPFSPMAFQDDRAIVENKPDIQSFQPQDYDQHNPTFLPNEAWGEPIPFSSDFSSFIPNYDTEADIHHEAENATGNLYDLLTKVSAFYRQQLSKNASALQYFYQRGLTDVTLATFELGYAPADWQHLEQAFPQDIEGLKILGLVRTSEKGKSYNLLRERVIFPIRDNQGRTVGFAGRALSDEVKPKYINSSESPVFHKQHQLFGLYEGRQVRAKDWLVVEGYMDVISLHQAGVHGAVAAMGTAIATPQIEKLLQLNPTLTLCFDGDEAGQKAAWRAMEVGLPALSDSKELRFLTLPQQHDPDTFVKTFGVAAMRQQIAHAIPLSQYLFSILSRRYDISIAEGRGKLLAEVSQLTQKLPKGSYGWLLREDMRSKMGLGKRQQAKAAQDALLNFDSEMTPQLQLQLCFLYQPELLGGYQGEGMNTQLIEHIFALSKANQVLYSPHVAANMSSQPSLALTWEDLANVELFTLVDWIQQSHEALSAFSQPLAENHAEYEIINAKAHFILAGLPPTYQAKILPKWQVFFYELQQRQVNDISDLVTEIMIKLVMDALQKKLITTKDLRKKQWLKNQSQLIKAWQQSWFEQKEAS